MWQLTGRKATIRLERDREFADSLLEGSGFELSVPPGLGPLRASTPTASQYSEPRNGPSFYGGTNSSNPLPSTGESKANPISWIMVDADAKKLAGATPITGFGRLLREH
jgi:hypothetical protein